jgi:hypothetical protein
MQMDVTWLENLDPTELESLNTPADLERFHAGLVQGHQEITAKPRISWGSRGGDN